MTMERHAIEAKDSWETYLSWNIDDNEDHHRRLKHHAKQQEHHSTDDDALINTKGDIDFVQMEHDKAEAYLQEYKERNEKSLRKVQKKHNQLMKQVYADPGIQHTTVHGMMIDAGSTGSRLHLYEWEPRILHDHHQVQDAVAGRKLSFPSSGDSNRWTDRLAPGIATFASITNDDDLLWSIQDYLSPLIDFAKTILREKSDMYPTFPIFFRATAGMRTLSKPDRSRVLNAIRTVFHNDTFCPFYFQDEYARILSGEEEAIFGWAGINFVMGNLLEETVGAGTVINPKLTYGALDMGGASTQISFYESNEDIMSNLFKLQIGQAKHWNLYAHSFLYYGLNEARNRFQATLVKTTSHGDDAKRLIQGIYNPCLPGGGTRQEVRLNIHIDSNNEETWDYTSSDSSTNNGYYQAVLVNDKETGDFESCLAYAKGTLHLENNHWCMFAHKGECAFNGVYMAELPSQRQQEESASASTSSSSLASSSFGEFLAFSNYYHVWEFLGLPQRASLQELYDATSKICSMSRDELSDFNDATAQKDDEEIDDYCFRSAYSFSLLRYGYGFQMDDYITATNVLNGQKVGWTVGAMLYEINSMPWEYVATTPKPSNEDGGNGRMIPPSYHRHSHQHSTFFVMVLLGIMVALVTSFSLRRQRRRREQYEPVKETETTTLLV